MPNCGYQSSPIISVRTYADLVCSDFSRGLLSGDLCRPLCSSRGDSLLDFRAGGCVSFHVFKSLVFEAEWNGQQVWLVTTDDVKMYNSQTRLIETLLKGNLSNKWEIFHGTEFIYCCYVKPVNCHFAWVKVNSDYLPTFLDYPSLTVLPATSLLSSSLIVLSPHRLW